MGEEVPVAVNPPGLDVTVYKVIAAPPFEPGVKDIVALPFPPTADTEVGASGSVRRLLAAVRITTSPRPCSNRLLSSKLYLPP